ncbi:MAG: PDZ domain-containing protein [Gemmatimonadaceae bacterium]|nr:PDZ domain-containing protein [Gemmatimonadaceae bacterium]
MRRLSSVLLALSAGAFPVVAQETLLLRQPSVSARHIAFEYASNIWIADRAGGAARRLTSFQGQSSDAKLSPDGSMVAFTGTYAGNADVYVVPVTGGEPKRLTWHPGADFVTGWTPDGKQVVFASGRASWAPTGVLRFWTIPVGGGAETAMQMPRAFQGHISPDGRKVAYRMASSWDDERRNYRGGQNKPIWILDLASNAVDTIPRPINSKELDPVWIGSDVYFISDRDGVQNVYKYTAATKQVTAVTRFRDFDVKTLESGAGVLVFEQAGRVHTHDPAANRTAAVSITAAGDFPWMAPQWKDVTSRISALALSPSGKRAMVEARGEIFTIPTDKGDWRNITRSSGTAERAPVWSPDGKTIAYFSDKGGEYQVVLAPQDGLGEPKMIAIPEPTFPYTPAFSPDSKKLVWHDVHLRLWVLDIPTGKAKVLDTDPWMVPERTLNPSWSPDSRWVAYAKRTNALYHRIYVANVETGATLPITDEMADATWPVFDASGKYLWFLGSTNFGLRSGWLDMTSYERPKQSALYVAILKAGEPSPFAPESDEEGAAPAAAPAAAATAAAPAAPAARPASPTPTVTIDVAGLSQRILAVPGVAAREYGLLKAGVAGTVFVWESVPAVGPTDGAAGGPIHRVSLKGRPMTIATGAVNYALSADGKKLLYRTAGASGGLFVIDAAASTAPVAGTGRLAAQLRMWLEPAAEFAQIFDEARRKVRDYFYVPNLHGTNWTKVVADYKQFLPHVKHRADLNYLLDWMGGELAIGHSYVNGGDLPELPPSAGGLLGADFTIDNGRYRFATVYDGENWNPDVRSPLAVPGVEVKAGEYLLAVNDVPLTASDNVFRLLDGTANRQTVLTVNTRPSLDGARRVTVVPVANEGGLRNRAWVERNRRIVDSLSNGRLAYLHLPNTGQGGYVNFNRYYFAQQDKQGAVVDERYNGGGSAADYIIELLNRDFDGYFNNPVADRRPFTSPAAGIFGPKVMIINEMAGSGGDLMPFMFKRRKIGPLIGTRTWGGLVATSDQAPFVDGGGLVAPRIGFFNRDGQWDVENVGVPADIEVENWPKDVIAGRDPQLERAVQEALKLLEANPVRRQKEPAGPTWGRRQP